jgi:DNA-binding response OmpR family regulator
MRILIVEDSAAMARLLGKGLEREGYAVDVVDSGRDAIWLATENSYDAIVLDVILEAGDQIEHVWDFAFDGDPRIVNVYVRLLRDKIDRPFGQASLETVRGLGYRIRDEAVGQAAD